MPDPVAGKPGLSPALPALRLALSEAQVGSSAKINAGYKYAGKFLHSTRATRTRCHRTSAHLNNSKRVKISLITEMPPAQGKGFAELGAHFLRHTAPPPSGLHPHPGRLTHRPPLKGATASGGHPAAWAGSLSPGQVAPAPFCSEAEPWAWVYIFNPVGPPPCPPHLPTSFPSFPTPCPSPSLWDSCFSPKLCSSTHSSFLSLILRKATPPTASAFLSLHLHSSPELFTRAKPPLSASHPALTSQCPF